MAPERLSVVVPAYNEERFLGALLERILAVDLSRFGLEREIVVVDDGSTDGTAAIARRYPSVRLFVQERNQGKGAAVRRGIQEARGEWLIIQDADLEYDPEDYLPMLEVLLTGRADAVYGSRYRKHPHRGALANLLSGKHPAQSLSAYLGGQSLSFVCLLFTGRYLTDTVTALKLFRTAHLHQLELHSSGFELDHELTARLLARHLRIAEVPIRYFPRSRAEGKKIGARDWFRAVATFARYRRG